jgi:hypothetical protein
MNVQIAAPPHLWTGLFGRGVFFEVAARTTVARALTGVLGLASDYVLERVQTVFRNGCPVDDLDASTVSGGDTLALAAAMPGLVGITMRRNSPVGGFRSDITDKGGQAGEPGLVRLKLFNMVADEAGPGLLARGVLVQGADLDAFLSGCGTGFFSRIDRVESSGRMHDAGWLARTGFSGAGMVELRVLPA